MIRPSANPPLPERDISLDFIRLIAILLVICIHVSAKGFPLMNQSHWWAVNAYESVSRISVPLFFMVTGALLLHRENTVASIVKRSWRIIVPLACWSALYLLWFKYTGTDYDDWVGRVLRAPVVAHLWYLYTLLGAYLFLPVMAGFFQANSLKNLMFVMGFWFIGATVVPTVFFLTQKEYVGINWGFLSLYAGYIVLGAVIYRKVTFKKVPLLASVLVWIACIVATAGLTWARSVHIAQANETFYAYTSPFVAIGAVAAFIVLREVSRKQLAGKETVARILAPLSRVNFGVYLIHVMVIFALDIQGFDFDFVNPWLGIPVITGTVFVISSAIVAVLQKLPLVRAIVPA
jgi:surface polysaccharide O-acyltransferase-like enzyme